MASIPMTLSGFSGIVYDARGNALRPAEYYRYRPVWNWGNPQPNCRCLLRMTVTIELYAAIEVPVIGASRRPARSWSIWTRQVDGMWKDKVRDRLAKSTDFVSVPPAQNTRVAMEMYQKDMEDAAGR